MSEITLYEAQKKKLQGLCEEHELTYRFRKDTYPITLTISPLQGVEAQMTMLEEPEETGYRSPESSMTWIFEDGNLTTVEIYPDQTLLAICFQGMNDDGALTHEQSFDIPMNYCPNCGRKLGW